MTSAMERETLKESEREEKEKEKEEKESEEEGTLGGGSVSDFLSMFISAGKEEHIATRDPMVPRQTNHNEHIKYKKTKYTRYFPNLYRNRNNGS